jgi:hypothetical protein
LPRDTRQKRIARNRITWRLDGEIAMSTIVANVQMRDAKKPEPNTRPFKIVALFCCVGLLASLCMAFLGFDVGAGFF